MKNRRDKVSSSEHFENGVNPLEKAIQQLAKLLGFCAPQSVTREMDALLDLISHFLAFELVSLL